MAGTHALHQTVPKHVDRMNVSFAFDAEPGSAVFLAGTFNGWDESSLPLCDLDESGHYRAEVPLLPGLYEYKIVLNGIWVADAKCARWKFNEHGTLNSVIEVPARRTARS